MLVSVSMLCAPVPAMAAVLARVDEREVKRLNMTSAPCGRLKSFGKHSLRVFPRFARGGAPFRDAKKA